MPFEGRQFVFETQPGVFSHDGPDRGSLLLLSELAPRLKAHQRLLDLGAGVGLVGCVAATYLTRGEAWMADCDVRAVRLATNNAAAISPANTHVVLGDLTLDLPERLRFDIVATNPPTHQGKEVLSRLVDEAHQVLRPGGSLWLVVNRLLSVRDMMTTTFGGVELVARDGGFMLFRSEKARLPHRKREPDHLSAG